ncbi:LOW QUALITY PROTEIN: GCN5-related N-acetyltransferase, partial [Micromonospora sp. M42]
MTDQSSLTIRPGGPGDAPTLLRLLDSATAWLTELGRTDQWGAEPASIDPRRIAQAEEWAAGDGLYLAEIDATVAGALVVGAATNYVPPATEPELYVNLLVTDRAYAGRGVGAALLAYAAELARETRRRPAAGGLLPQPRTERSSGSTRAAGSPPPSRSSWSGRAARRGPGRCWSAGSA